MADSEDHDFTTSEFCRETLKHIGQIALLTLNEMIRGLPRILRPTGFRLLLTLLTLAIAFCLTYPLFFFESPSVTRLLDEEVSLLPSNASFVELATDYSEHPDVSKVTMAPLDAFGHYLGRDSYEDWDIEKAEQSINRALVEEPDSPFLHLLKAEFLRTYLKDLDSAVAHYTTAVELDNTLSTAYLGRGFCYFQKGKFQPAVKDFNRSIQIDQDPRVYIFAHILRGATYEHLGLYHNAIVDYTAAIQQDETDSVLHFDWQETLFFRRGCAYRESERWDKCVADFDRAMAIDLNSSGFAWVNSYWNRAACLEELHIYEEALADYRDLHEYWSASMDDKEVQFLEQRIARLEVTIEEQDQE
jgi:tetratricopeptide (TPR) repeat protein